MPTEAVWIVVTIPRRDFELSYNKSLENSNLYNGANNDNEKRNKIINSTKNEDDHTLESILGNALDFLKIVDSVWVPSKNGSFYHVYFPVAMENNDFTMHFLKSKGIGCRSNSAVGYIPFGLFYHNEKMESGDPFDYNKNYYNQVKESFLKSVTSRLTVAQVVDGVVSGAAITFDFYMYLLCSSVIGAMGIMNTNAVDVAASMMIEPLMGSVMAIAFGMAIWDRSVFMTGVKSIFWGLVFCLIFGYIYGLIFQLWRVAWDPPPDGIWPPPEMQSRGEYKSLIYGAVIATAGGAILAVILLKNNICALTGVAVATTFMPPFVNAGLCFALATHLQIAANSQDYLQYNVSGDIRWMKPAYVPNPDYETQYVIDMRVELAILGCISMAYTFVNVFFLGVSSYAVLKLKEIVPLRKISPSDHKFFTEDIKIYRAHRKKYPTHSIGQQILEEWADIAGLNKKELLNNSHESKATQLQTLHDIAQDVEADDNYQTITRNAFGRKYQSHLGRRLTQPTLFQNQQQLNNNNNNNNNNPNRGPYTIEMDSAGGGGDDGLGRRNPGFRSDSIHSNAAGGPSNIRRSLRYSVNSPYSVWPANQNPTSHGVRNRSESIISSSYINNQFNSRL